MDSFSRVSLMETSNFEVCRPKAGWRAMMLEKISETVRRSDCPSLKASRIMSFSVGRGVESVSADLTRGRW